MMDGITNDMAFHFKLQDSKSTSLHTLALYEDSLLQQLYQRAHRGRLSKLSARFR